MAKAVLNFAIFRGEQFERRESVAQDIVKVGKDPKSHLRIDDEAASRMHAVIEVSGTEDVTLIDLGNDPGTLVNGARVNKTKLQVGDYIQIGTTQILLESVEPAYEQPVAAAPPAQMPQVTAMVTASRTMRLPDRTRTRSSRAAPTCRATRWSFPTSRPSR